MSAETANPTETPAPVKETFSSRFLKEIKKEIPAPVANNASPEEKKEPAKEVENKSKEENSSAEETKQPSILDSFSKANKPKEETKTSSKEENLANLRKKLEEREKAYEELDRSKKELEGKIPSDYDQLKQKLGKYEEDLNLVTSELKKYNVAATPEFKEKYDKKISSAFESISKALTNADSEVDAQEFLSLVKSPEGRQRSKEIAEKIAGVDDFSKNKIAAAIAEYDRVREQREAELSNPDQILNQREADRVAQQKAQQEFFAKTIEDVLASAPKEVPFLVKGEDSEWNSVIDSVNQTARKLYLEPTTPTVQAQVALRAALTPILFDVANKAQVELEKANAIIKELRGGNPKVTTQSKEESKAKTGKGSFVEKFLAATQGK